MTTLVLYCYKETHDTMKNIEYFIEYGINSSADFVFIVNNNICSVTFPPNVTVIKREEDEYDLITYKWYFDTYKPEYNNYYFVNSSCIGPFLPSVVSENWINLFNNKLKEYDLIAPIIEFPPDSCGYSLIKTSFTDKNIPFLHTYMFGTKSKEVLLKFFSNIIDTTHDSIILYERTLTSIFLINNKKIYSFLMRFKNVDVNNKQLWNSKFWNITDKSCYEVPNNYFGMDINPLEIVFVKNIRKSHKFRDEQSSNISSNLSKMLNLYISWY